MTEKIKWIVVIVVSLALGAATIAGIESVTSDEAAPAVIERVTSSSGTSVAQTTSLNDVADLYARVRPSVVQINAQSSRTNASGLGSGIMIDSKGHILTNNHVVAGSDQLDVQLADGTAVPAKVVGTDPGSDLAVIRVDLPADKIKPATLGDSSKVRVGEAVIAIGNPFGIAGTVTEGIVSGVGRTLGGGAGRPLRQLIQSDAAINPGNSGGALFDARGNVIGITTAIENPSGDRVFAGIGYAVPINTAQRFLPELLAGRTVQHPRLGAVLQNLTPALARSLGVNVDQGVLVTQVDANSGAARAGMRGGAGGRGAPVGDVIVSIDDKEMKTFDDLANYIDSKNVGDRVQVKLVRDGRQMTLDVSLEAWQASA